MGTMPNETRGVPYEESVISSGEIFLGASGVLHEVLTLEPSFARDPSFTGAGCDTLMNWVPCVAPPLEPPPAFTACDPTPPVPPRNRSGGTDADCWRGRAAWPLWTDARPAWRS